MSFFLLNYHCIKFLSATTFHLLLWDTFHRMSFPALRNCLPFFRIEDKQRTVTDIELYGLAKVLGVSIEELFQNSDK